MPKPQSYANHARFRPLFHFVLMPLLLINFVSSIVYVSHHYYKHIHLGPLWIVMSLALILIALDHRMSALQAQDRIIRLEERLRMAALGVPHDVAHALTERQFIGLRFASDAELPELARRAVHEHLSEKQIKQSIQNWRADHFRV
jgi:hypothetical protein